ncbi:hypothetical protein GGS20DRAFT_361234 [Poronia punctata]|nr:hypothetical protein GGS20DRAFT_361234 [Poronia punctata]
MSSYENKQIIAARIKALPRADRETARYEEYLREKWDITDPMPDSFDPERLEAMFQARRRRENGPVRREERPRSISELDSTIPVPVPEVDSTIPVTVPVIPELDSTPLAELDATNGIEALICTIEKMYTTDANIDYDGEGATCAPPSSSKSKPRSGRDCGACTLESEAECGRGRGRVPTPRIRAGSKPPLSKSAFVEGGVPCLNKDCSGDCARVAKQKYFPFQNRTRRRSRSGSSSSSRSRGRS